MSFLFLTKGIFFIPPKGKNQLPQEEKRSWLEMVAKGILEGIEINVIEVGGGTAAFNLDGILPFFEVDFAHIDLTPIVVTVIGVSRRVVKPFGEGNDFPVYDKVKHLAWIAGIDLLC